MTVSLVFRALRCSSLRSFGPLAVNVRRQSSESGECMRTHHRFHYLHSSVVITALCFCFSSWYFAARPVQNIFSSEDDDYFSPVYRDNYLKSLNFPEDYWAEVSNGIQWMRKWDKVLDSRNPPFYQWWVATCKWWHVVRRVMNTRCRELQLGINHRL